MKRFWKKRNIDPNKEDLTEKGKKGTKKVLSKKTKEAEKIINDPKKVEERLKAALDNLHEIDFGPINDIKDDVLLLISVVGDWIKGIYREIPLSTIIMILGGIIYFVSPVDFIPDYIPMIGYIDDAFVLSLIIKKIKEDLDNYKRWKEEKSE
ncbi:MAG TPA: YkvA family protein [Tissierellaceae bacterium]|nr:YkvA family protein [Tissierellaceae bacterium]